jgi:multiple sugar transport system permease protein
MNEAALGGLYLGLIRNGRSVPRDFSVVGVVAGTWAERVTPALTAAGVPAREMCRVSVEAALVDGCGRLGVLLRIVVPVMVPGLVAVAGLSFLLGWGEFIFGLTLAKQPDVQPVTVVLNTFVGQYGTSWGPLMATATIIAVPVVCVFAIFQCFIVGGLTAGSVKA